MNEKLLVLNPAFSELDQVMQVEIERLLSKRGFAFLLAARKEEILRYFVEEQNKKLAQEEQKRREATENRDRIMRLMMRKTQRRQRRGMRRIKSKQVKRGSMSMSKIDVFNRSKMISSAKHGFKYRR